MSACIGSPSGNADALGFAATNGQRGPNSTYSVGGTTHSAPGHPTRSHNTIVTGVSGSSSSYQPYIVVNYIIKAKTNYGVMVMSAQNAAVIDNCTSNSSTDALSAHQGKILNDILRGLLNGTTLFEGNKSYGNNITLSESISNFDRIKIIGYTDYGARYEFERDYTIPLAGKNIMIEGSRQGSASKYCTHQSLEFSSDGLTVTLGNTATYQLNGSGISQYSINTYGYVKITKIIGYKYNL